MFILAKVLRALRRYVQRVSWGMLLLTYTALLGALWLLLAWAAEEALLDPVAFLYFAVTTSTTIGYGDLSPQTQMGRLIVALIFMPASVALFTAILAKTGNSLVLYWQRHLRGIMSYEHLSGHTVLVGWKGTDSARLIQLLLSDRATVDEGIALVAEGLSENPMPGVLRFVSTDGYAEVESYRRVAAENAARIIINTTSDDQTLAAALAVKAGRPNAHMVAHFERTASAELLHTIYPDIECTRPMAAEIIARAAQDPGSSYVTLDLLSCEHGTGTQFTIELPAGPPATFCTLQELFTRAGATLLGYRAPGVRTPRLNAGSEHVPMGSMLFYLSPRRLTPADLWMSRGA